MLQPPVKRPRWLRCTVVVASLILAFAARIYLEPWLRWQSPFALLLPAVLVSAWYGGARAGLLATTLAGLGGAAIFLPPVGHLLPTDVSDTAALGLFLVEGFLLSCLCEVLHRAVDNAQRAAHEATRKFEVLANSAPVLIWSTDPAGRCIFVNRNWLTFTGHADSPQLDAAWLAHIHPDDLAAYRHAYSRAATQQQPYQFEYRLRRADGVYRWLLEHAIPRRDTAGRFEGFIGSGTDITASRREREDLDFVARLQRGLGSSLDVERVAAALHQAMVPALADCFCLELINPEGRLTPVQCHPGDALLGSLPVSATVAEAGETLLTSRVDAAQLSAGVSDLLQRTWLQTSGLVSHLAMPLHARGRILGVLTLATRESGRVLGAEELALVQKIGGIAGFAIDNARLHQRTLEALRGAEEARQHAAASQSALERQRALLQTIIDAVPALVAYVGPDGRVLLHNERYPEWLGREDATLSGSLTDAASQAVSTTTSEHIQAALGGVSVNYEDTWKTDTSARQVEASLCPDRDEQGRVCGVVFHAYDITERSRAYAELAAAREQLHHHAEELEQRVRERTATLRETNAELEAFTYSVSHDLRTPLQFIRSFAEAVGTDRSSQLGADSRGHLDRITRAASRMESIIHDLLDYSRLGRAEITLAPLPLQIAIAEAVAQQAATIRQLGAQVLITSPLPSVQADHVGLFQILSNLLSNALKFTVPGRAPIIRLHTEQHDTVTRLWIIDNGIGIHGRHHEKIFQLFERLHSAAEYPGTGIGLALVRKAAMRMGGYCGVESVPGTGSRFWIDFKPAPAAAPAAPTDDHRQDESTAAVEAEAGLSRIPA